MIVERATAEVLRPHSGSAGTLVPHAERSTGGSRPIALSGAADPLSAVVAVRRASGSHRRAPRVSRPLDLFMALSVLAAVLVASNAHDLPAGLEGFLAMRVTVKNIALLVMFCAAWLMSLSVLGLYDARMSRRPSEEVLRIVAACTLASLALLPFPLVTAGHGALKYSAVLLYWLMAVVTMLATHPGARLVRRSVAKLTARRVIIIGTGPRATEMSRRLRSDLNVRYDILGFVDTREAAERRGAWDNSLGFLDQFEQTLMQTSVDEVLIALPIKSHYAEIEAAIRACERAGVHSKYLADVFSPSLSRPRLDVAGDVPCIAMQVVQDDFRLVVKRVLDLTCTVLVLPVVVPLCLFIAAAIKLTSPGPVIFGQERFGRHKRRFRMYKFRTMIANAEAMQAALETRNEVTGPVFKIQDDPRVTRLGRLLRRTSLDELPQLINVLRGDMSLVGPRPLAVRDVGLFLEAWLMRRFSVQPGLTCLWQVSGRSNLDFQRWIELDLEYIDRWSLGLDLKIMLRTAPAVLRGTGAS